MLSFALAWALTCAVRGQVPTVTYFTPAYGTPGDQGTVAIYVQGVAGASDIQGVAFNTTWVALGSWFVTAYNGTWGWEVRSVIPAGATTGPISVRNVSGQVGISLDDFVVFGPGPRPLDFIPKSGRTNTTVVIEGDRFIAGTQVFFVAANGEVEAQRLSNPIQSQITAVVPVGAITGPIRLSSSQGSNRTVASFLVIQDIDLEVALEAEPATGLVGKALELVSRVRNTSAFPASGVILTNALDPTVVFTNATSSQGGTPTHADGVVTAVLGQLAAGAQAEVRVTVWPTAEGQIQTSAGAFGNEPDPDLTNNVATLDMAVIRSDIDLEVEMATEPDAVYEGEPMRYLLTVRNLGPAKATSVVLSDELPAVVSPVAVTVSQGQGQIAGNTVTASFGSLEPEAVADANITVLVNTRTPFTNSAAVTASEPDSNPTNDLVTLQTIPQVREADVGVSQAILPEVPWAGEYVTNRITVTNRGPDRATQVRVVDTLPPEVLFVSSRSSQGTSALNGRFVIADLGSLDPDATATVTIVAIPTTLTKFTNLVEVSALQPDPNAANNRSALIATADVHPPEIQVQLTPEGELVLEWPAYPAESRLQSAPHLGDPIAWSDVTETPQIVNGRSILRVDLSEAAAPARYYRVIIESP